MARKKSRDHLSSLFGYLIDLKKWNKKHVEQPDGCIHFEGLNHRQGYQFFGCIRESDDKRIHMTAHRLAMRFKLNRDLTTGEQVIHTCSNIRCVNPDHLFIGTTSDRAQNMVRNGRAPVNVVRQIKKQNRKYKYTIDEMIFIKTHTPHEIMNKFNLDSSKAHNLHRGFQDGYKWLEEYINK
jgi:hypothetical protein